MSVDRAVVLPTEEKKVGGAVNVAWIREIVAGSTWLFRPNVCYFCNDRRSATIVENQRFDASGKGARAGLREQSLDR